MRDGEEIPCPDCGCEDAIVAVEYKLIYMDRTTYTVERNQVGRLGCPQCMMADLINDLASF